MERACRTCRWWDRMKKSATRYGGNGKSGLCRIRPPFPMIVGQASQGAPWPETWPDDWCREYEPGSE